MHMCVCVYSLKVDPTLKPSLIHFTSPHSTFTVTAILYSFNKYWHIPFRNEWMTPNLLSLNHHKFIFSDTWFHLFRTWSIPNSNRCLGTAGRNYTADTKSSNIALRLTSSPSYVLQTAVPSWKRTWLQEQALFVILLSHSRINMTGLDVE